MIRRLSLTTLLAAALFSTPMWAEGEETTQYVVNGDFESGTATGWTNTTGATLTLGAAANDGIQTGTNASIWSPTAIQGKVYQTVKGLPVGAYKLEAGVWATTGTQKLCLYAGNKRVDIEAGQEKTYAIDSIIVVDGQLEVGLDITSATNFAFDNVRLTATTVDTNEIARLLYQQCVADTLRKDRQRWFNHEQMHEATAAYEAGADNAIALLTAAHQRFEEITIAYTTMREEAATLYTACAFKKFAPRDTVKQIRRTVSAYYVKDEDHLDYMVDMLPVIRQLAALYADHLRLGKAISEARNQYKATDYPGRDILATAMHEAYVVQTTATTATAFDQGITDLREAVKTYLAGRPSEWVTIQNGKLWRTTAGQTMQAHAPGFVRVGDIFYMCGEDRSGPWNPDVNLYSSTDLVHWRFEKKIVANGKATPELGHGRMIERPKLLYNARTDKYVVWCHYEAGNYGASEAACFECDSVNGDYTYVWSGRPRGVKSRDCNVFQDNDGTAYFISTTEENQHLGLFRLSDDYHEAVSHTQLFSWKSREAPAIVRINDIYFMFNSACSGWDPNRQKMSYTRNLTSGWTDLKNVGNEIAYDTQAAAILTIKGTKATTYLYVGDRWQDPDLQQTKTIIFPITFNGTQCDFRYHERFDINFVTGEWRETPTDDYFVSKQGWRVVDFSSEETSSERGAAADAIDGNLQTKWHSHYSGTVAAAPHYITVDMGQTQTIKGFLAMPRMDDSASGLVRKYTFQTSLDGETWKTASEGDWLPYATEVSFSARDARYVKFICREGTYCSLAELDVVRGTPTPVIAPTAETTEVVRTEYYNMSGARLSHPQRGLYIEKKTYSDGHTTATKIMK